MTAFFLVSASGTRAKHCPWVWEAGVGRQQSERLLKPRQDKDWEQLHCYCSLSRGLCCYCTDEELASQAKWLKDLLTEARGLLNVQSALCSQRSMIVAQRLGGGRCIKLALCHF